MVHSPCHAWETTSCCNSWRVRHGSWPLSCPERGGTSSFLPLLLLTAGQHRLKKQLCDVALNNQQKSRDVARKKKTYIRSHTHTQTRVCDWMHTHTETAHCMTYKQGMSWKETNKHQLKPHGHKAAVRPSQYKDQTLRKKWSWDGRDLKTVVVCVTLSLFEFSSDQLKNLWLHLQSNYYSLWPGTLIFALLTICSTIWEYEVWQCV